MRGRTEWVASIFAAFGWHVIHTRGTFRRTCQRVSDLRPPDILVRGERALTRGNQGTPDIAALPFELGQVIRSCRLARIQAKVQIHAGLVIWARLPTKPDDYLVGQSRPSRVKS